MFILIAYIFGLDKPIPSMNLLLTTVLSYIYLAECASEVERVDSLVDNVTPTLPNVDTPVDAKVNNTPEVNPRAAVRADFAIPALRLANTNAPLLPFRDCVTPINSSTYVSNTNTIFDRFNITLVDGTTPTTLLQSSLGLFQKVCEDGSNDLYITITNTNLIPVATTLLNIVFTPKPDAFPSDTLIPLVYSVFSNVSTGVVVVADATLATFTIQVPVTLDIANQILLVSELGIVNRATFSYVAATTTLTSNFYSDIFTTNPVVDIDLTFPGIVPVDYLLPNNEMITLLGIFNMLKCSAIVKCISEEQLKRIEVAAAINDIRSLFCRRNRCCKPICETAIYVEYVTFVSSCIQVIAHCSETKACPKELVCEVVAENRCEWMNKRIVDCCRCLQSVSAKVNVDVCAMFGDVFPCDMYAPCTREVSVHASAHVEVIEGAPCFEESLPCIEGVPCYEESSSEMEEAKRRRMKDRKKPAKRAVTVKSTTSVSTYGWYAAGGVVIVSVAVAVYVFVL